MDGTSNITFIGHQTDPNLVLISAKGLSAFIIRSNLSGSFSMYLKTIEDLELTYNTTLMFYGKGPPFYNNMKMHPDAIRAIMQKRNIQVHLKELESKLTSLNFLEQGVMKIKRGDHSCDQCWTGSKYDYIWLIYNNLILTNKFLLSLFSLSSCCAVLLNL